MSEKDGTGNAPGGEGSDESHNAPIEPPVPSDASVSESADDDGFQQDGNCIQLHSNTIAILLMPSRLIRITDFSTDANYVVIFTPKVIISDSEVQPLPGETLNFFYRRHEIQQSRAHILDRVKGELKISSSVWESQIISATASHSHVLPPGNRSRVIMSHTQSQTVQLEIFRSRSHKLRFQTDQACQVLSSAVTKKHIAPEVSGTGQTRKSRVRKSMNAKLL